MATFGIIAEGITDQLIIKNILTGYLKDAGEEPFFTPVQPREAPPGSDPPPAGWTLVFKSIEAGDHRKALQFNDYVVIQIDTDVSQEKGFDVPWHDGGRELTAEELINRVTARLRDALGRDFCEAHGDRVIFAIAVHQIECWLLPLFFEDKQQKAEKITGCLDAANDARRKQNKLPLKKGDQKQPRVYEEVSREYARPRRLMKLYGLNPSLNVFIEGLDALLLRASAEGSSPEES